MAKIIERSEDRDYPYERFVIAGSVPEDLANELAVGFNAASEKWGVQAKWIVVPDDYKLEKAYPSQW